MTPEHADAIEAAGADLGLADITTQHDYSGRGMFGARTSGVVGRPASILAAVALAATRMDRGEAEEFAAALADTATDSMGRETIVY